MARPEVEICEIVVQHEDVINRVRAEMLPMEQRAGLADFFKNLGDPTRLGILWALSVSEMCVCDLAALLGMGQSAVSHQLRTLRQARLVKSRREGKVVFYSLSDDHPGEILRGALEHIAEEN